jgi:AraC-like DNA-binding protein
MSEAIGVFHGSFGRATVYHLDRPIIPHAHKDGHLIFHVSGSHSHVLIGGVHRTISPEVAIAVNPWELHSYSPDEPEGQYALVLYIRPSWFALHGPHGTIELRFGSADIPVTPEVSLMVSQLTDLLTIGARWASFDRLLYDLIRSCHRLSHRTPEKQALVGTSLSLRDFRLRKSLRLMSERLDHNLDVTKLASDSGLSRPHFFKMFRTQIGITPKLFWNSLRLERAFHDLVETPKLISDIALELGFSSQSNFSRFFALNTGLAPIEYRRVGHIVQCR